MGIASISDARAFHAEVGLPLIVSLFLPGALFPLTLVLAGILLVRAKQVKTWAGGPHGCVEPRIMLSRRRATWQRRASWHVITRVPETSLFLINRENATRVSLFYDYVSSLDFGALCVAAK